MGQITTGTVVFGRTIQPAQYESKKAEVTLSFSLAEGEDLGDMLDKVAVLAQNKALEMVGLQGATPAKVPAKPSPVAVPGPKTEAPKTEAPKPAKTPPKTPKVVTINGAKVGLTPEEQVAAVMAVDALDEPRPQISTNPENRVEELDEFADKAPTITDEQLDKIGHAFTSGGIAGAGKKIRDLRDKFTGKPGQPLRTLAPELRQAFVDELAKLT